MRIVIKPAGAALLLLAIGSLVFLVVRKNASTNSSNNHPYPTPYPTPTPGQGRTSGGGSSYSANTPQARPARTGQAIIDSLDKKWVLTAPSPAKATMTDFTADDLPLGTNAHATHLVVTAVDPKNYSSVQIVQRVPRPIASGHQLEVRFWGRSAKGSAAYVVFEEGAGSHTAELSKMVTLGPQWQEYTLPFVTAKDHTTTPPNVSIKAGVAPGDLDISDVRVADYGK